MRAHGLKVERTFRWLMTATDPSQRQGKRGVCERHLLCVCSVVLIYLDLRYIISKQNWNLKTKLTNVKASDRLWVNYRQPTECSKIRTGSFKMDKLFQEKNLLKRRRAEWETTLLISKMSLMETMILPTMTERLNRVSNHLITCEEATIISNKVKESHSQDHHQLVR